MMVVFHDDDSDVEQAGVTCNLEVVLVLARVIAVFISPQVSLKSRVSPKERLTGRGETVGGCT